MSENGSTLFRKLVGACLPLESEGLAINGASNYCQTSSEPEWTPLRIIQASAFARSVWLP